MDTLWECKICKNRDSKTVSCHKCNNCGTDFTLRENISKVRMVHNPEANYSIESHVWDMLSDEKVKYSLDEIHKTMVTTNKKITKEDIKNIIKKLEAKN